MKHLTIIIQWLIILVLILILVTVRREQNIRMDIIAEQNKKTSEEISLILEQNNLLVNKINEIRNRLIKLELY